MHAAGRAALIATLAWASRVPSTLAADVPGASRAVIDSAGTPAATAAADTGLAASSAPPWNPPAPVPAAETWETVVRAPGVVLSLPLVGLGAIAKSGLSYVERNTVLPRVQALLVYQGKVGIGVLPAQFGDRVGLALGLHFSPPWFRWLDASVAASTGHYNLANVALRNRFLRIEYQSGWRSKDQFFGLGLDAQKSSVSTYASQTQIARAILTASLVPGPKPRPQLDLSAWAGGRDLVLLDGRDPRKPDLSEVHPALAASLLGVHIEHLIYGGSIALDGRRGRPHWTRGYRLSVRADRFDPPIEGFVLRSAHTPGDQFLRFTYQAEGGLSLGRDPRTIRLSVKVVDQRLDSTTGIFILPDLAKLGGQDGLVGFEPGRFQSTDAAAAKLSYIFPLGRYVEVDAHTEAGGVYSNLGDLQGSTLKHSYGTTVRIRSTTRLLGGFGFNWSAESLRFGFQIGGGE